MTPFSMKGSFAQVIKPISEEVVRPFLKSSAYWGNVTCDFEQIRDNNKDLIGFHIDVVTSRGTYRHIFKRETDTDGFFKWTQVSAQENRELTNMANCPLCGGFLKIYEVKILTAESSDEPYLLEGTEVRCSRCNHQDFTPKRGGR